MSSEPRHHVITDESAAKAADPATWGPSMWRFLHCAALAYPSKGDESSAAAFRRFVDALGDVLPCPTCAHNYRRHLQELPVDPFLAGRAALFEWTVQLHNLVNVESGGGGGSGSKNMRGPGHHNKPLLSAHQALHHLLLHRSKNKSSFSSKFAAVMSNPLILACSGLVFIVVAILLGRRLHRRVLGVLCGG